MVWAEIFSRLEINDFWVVDQTVASWNQVKTWLERVVALS